MLQLFWTFHRIRFATVEPKMALEEVCGFNKMPFMRRPALDFSDFGRNVVQKSENFQDPYKLGLPPVENPISANVEPGSSDRTEVMGITFDHGTTTLAFKYQGGVLVAVDSRSTNGMYIGSNNMKKVVEINDFLLGTLAGCAADCVYWDRVLTKECRLYELRNKARIPVAAAANIMADVGRKYQGLGLSMGMMLVGYERNGPELHLITSRGWRSRGNLFSVGSGSAHAYGLLDTEYHWNLTDEEAQELGKRAICQATYRDAFSGGTVRVYQMTANGFVHISNDDCADLFDKYEKLKCEKKPRGT